MGRDHRACDRRDRPSIDPRMTGQSPRTDPAADRMVLVATMTMRLFCPRCDLPQTAILRWYGNAVLAQAIAQTVAHDCPAAPASSTDVPLW